jgi:hypothetical protein
MRLEFDGISGTEELNDMTGSSARVCDERLERAFHEDVAARVGRGPGWKALEAEGLIQMNRADEPGVRLQID